MYMPVSDTVEPVNQYIRKEQVARLAQQLPVNLIANVCVVIAFLFIYHEKINPAILVVWTIYSQLVNLYGLLLTFKYRVTDAVSASPNCLKWFSFYALADGLTSASAMWIFFVPDGGFYNFFLFTVLVGVSAGGQATFLSHLATALPFSMFITASAILRLASAGEMKYLVLAGMVMVFSGVLVRIAFSFNRNLIATWRLRYELEGELKERSKVEAGLRESQEQYRRLVELSPDAIVVQQDDKVVYANDAAVTLFAATDAQHLLDYDLMVFFPAEVNQYIHETIRALVSDHGDMPYIEVCLLRLDERLVEVELRGKAIYYNGKPAVQLVIRDISERKQMDKMKDEFISIVSHELRTPITAILGAAGIMRGVQLDSLDEKQKLLVNIIYNNSQTLSSLVNDILDVSKLEGGKLALSITESDINALLDEVIKDNTTYASQFKVRLELKRDLTTETINTDAMRLKQIFNNLISNAIKHSPERGSVVIHATNDEKFLVASIQDHGSGIPAAFQGRIFNKFEQSQDNSRKVIKGTGLGLYLTKSLIEQFNGEIWYETGVGEGTTFYIKLPIH